MRITIIEKKKDVILAPYSYNLIMKCIFSLFYPDHFSAKRKISKSVGRFSFKYDQIGVGQSD